MSTLQSEIVVRFTAEGWHCWPQAPDRRAYLRQSHRHLFHVEARLQVLHNDREVEFHDLLDFCRENFPSGDLGSRSCEMLASGLLDKIKDRHAGRSVSVGVFEDGEVGAVVSIYQLSPSSSIHNSQRPSA